MVGVVVRKFLSELVLEFDFPFSFPEALIVSVEPSFGNYMSVLRNTRQFRNVVTVHAGLWPTVSTLGIMQGPRTPNALEWGFMVQEMSEVKEEATLTRK